MRNDSEMTDFMIPSVNRYYFIGAQPYLKITEVSVLNKKYHIYIECI